MNSIDTSKSGDLHDERTDYQRDVLRRAKLDPSPLTMFGHWMEAARQHNIIDATAMTLATVDENGQPSARIVLLKQYDEAGFCWYTNYESRKGCALAHNPGAALLFFWREFERQIRIEGKVEKMTTEESDAYFNSRPAGSRYSAAASPQSQTVTDQQWLETRVQSLENEFPLSELRRPDNWGGYRLRPETFEFWQGRPSRLHDRFRYQATPDGWQIDRLAP